MPRRKILPNDRPLSSASATFALQTLEQRGLLSRLDIDRLKALAKHLPTDTHKLDAEAALALMYGTDHPADKAELSLRALVSRFHSLQTQAQQDGHITGADLLTLHVEAKSGKLPRRISFSGQVQATARARTPDLEGVTALIENTALPPELLGTAAKGSEPILLLTVNEHETAALRQVFGTLAPAKSFLRDGDVYELLGYHERRPLIAFRCGMGSLAPSAATLRTARAIQHHSPAVVLAVGIAFGNKNKNQVFGDVLLSEKVRTYESERLNPDHSHEWRGDPFPAAASWVDRATQLAPAGFALHKGLMLSGEKLFDNEEALQALYKHFPKAIGGDMEGVGLVAACHSGKVDWLVIKGVSDWGDGSKSTIGDERKTKDQQLAALHAAQVTFAAIFLRWPQPADGAAPAATPQAPAKPLPAIEAKTPDLNALTALIENQGQQAGFDPRQVDQRQVDQPQARRQPQGEAAQVPAHQTLLDWLQNPEAPPVFALLGEYGMGKTICCQRLYRELRSLRAQGQAPAWAREPLYFDLRKLSLFRNRDRTQTVEMPSKAALINDLIQHGWQLSPGSPAPTYADVQTLLAQGALLILDGLDECLVHLVDAQHPGFVASLLELLTDADPQEAAGARLLLSCRTNFFKTLDDQRNLFTGQHRGKIDGSWYQPMVLQPFSEAQIRQYLSQVVPDIPVERIMELVASTHNLGELAERPMTLKLIAGQIRALEALRLRGEPVNSATLYELVARSWLERDDGKHHLQPEHKLRLMPALAAHLWQQGTRSLPYDALHRWFHTWRASQPDLAERYGPAVYNQTKLEEDLRTATFVVRQDESADANEGFRFAHTSLLEFFLARHLADAVLADQPAAWDMPLPSHETLQFVADLLSNAQDSLRRGGQDPALPERTLNQWRKTYRPRASELLLRYALAHGKHRLHARAAPAPLLAGFNLAGAQLRGWRFGTPQPAAGEPLLPMQSCNFAGADLREARFDHVRLDDADFSAARLERAALQHCSAQQTLWQQAQLTGTVLRQCAIEKSRWRPMGDSYRLQLVGCRGVEVLGDEVNQAGQPWVLPPPEPASGPNLPSLPARGQAPDSAGPPGLPPRLAWLVGHSSFVTSVAFSPDGLRLISGSFDNSIRLWDASTGEVLATFLGHASAVTSVAFSPDGLRLASGSKDRTIRLWDASSGDCLATLTGHTFFVTSVAFSPDGLRLLSGSYDHSLRLWDASTGDCLATLKGHSSGVTSVAFSPNGLRLLSGSYDHSLCLWDASTGDCLATLEGHSDIVTSVAFSSDSSRLLSGSDDNSIRLWDASSGDCVATLTGHYSNVTSVAFSPDGLRLLSGSHDNSLRLWDASSGDCLATLTGHFIFVTSVAFSPDGLRLLSGSYDQSLRLWDASSGDCLATLTGHISHVTSVTFSPDGLRLLSCSQDNSIRLWDASSGNCLAPLTGHSFFVTGAAFSPDGLRLLSGSQDNSIRLWDASSGNCLATLTGHSSAVTSVAFSPDGLRLISGSDDNSIRLWDAFTGKALATLSGHSGTVTSVAFSPDGLRLISGSYDHSIRLWDASTGEPLATLTGHSGTVTSVAFSPDGLRLVSGSYDKSIRLWDASTGEPLATLTGHSSAVTTVAFSPDGLRLISGSDDNSIRLWDASSGEPLATFSGHTRSVTSVAFSPDGLRLISGSEDGSVRLWETPGSAEDPKLSPAPPCPGRCLRIHWASSWGNAIGHATWRPPHTDDPQDSGELISASGDAWRVLAWQVWDHPSAPGQWTRLPLLPY